MIETILTAVILGVLIFPFALLAWFVIDHRRTVSEREFWERRRREEAARRQSEFPRRPDRSYGRS